MSNETYLWYLFSEKNKNQHVKTWESAATIRMAQRLKNLFHLGPDPGACRCIHASAQFVFFTEIVFLSLPLKEKFIY